MSQILNKIHNVDCLVVFYFRKIFFFQKLIPKNPPTLLKGPKPVGTVFIDSGRNILYTNIMLGVPRIKQNKVDP